MKHTPGPWLIDRVQDYDFQITISSKHRFVASAHTLDATEETEEEKSNAILIAAAPDLYDFVDMLTHAMALPESVREKAKQVIAKADGVKHDDDHA